MSNTNNEAMVQTIRTKMTTDVAWIERAILALYARQTTDEQAVRTTRYFNMRGFRHGDDRFFSIAAETLLAGGHLNAQEALTKHGPRLVKYSRQLARIAAEKAARKAAAAVTCPLFAPVNPEAFMASLAA